MANEKELEGVLVTGNENPITELVTKWRDYRNFLDKWTPKQSLPVKAAVITTTEGIKFAGIGLVFGFLLNKTVLRNVQKEVCCSLRCPLLMARLFAIPGAAQASIYSVMEELRGKKDTATCMLAGFGSGVLYSMACGARGPKVIFPGAGFALYHVGVFKIEKSNWDQHNPANTRTYVEEEEKVSDQSYYRTRLMLSNLGLQDYENNFKKGLFTDETLPLLTYRDLQEMDIPAGARLRIFDYIKRGERDEEIKRFEGCIRSSET